MRRLLVFQHVPHEILGTLDPLLRDAGFRIRYVNFGRNPDTSKTQTGTDFTELYWRMWIKLPTGFVGHPGKLSRARVLALADYTDAATGHLWDGSTARS